MKFFVNFTILLIVSSISFSQTLSGKERGDRASLSIRLANYTTETAKTLPVTMMADIESFSNLELSEKNDLSLARNVIKTLLIMDVSEKDGGDPSRTAVIMLIGSYKKYSSIYNKAFQQLENSKNKEQLKEFKIILSEK